MEGLTKKNADYCKSMMRLLQKKLKIFKDDRSENKEILKIIVERRDWENVLHYMISDIETKWKFALYYSDHMEEMNKFLSMRFKKDIL